MSLSAASLTIIDSSLRQVEQTDFLIIYLFTQRLLCPILLFCHHLVTFSCTCIRYCFTCTNILGEAPYIINYHTLHPPNIGPATPWPHPPTTTDRLPLQPTSSCIQLPSSSDCRPDLPAEAAAGSRERRPLWIWWRESRLWRGPEASGLPATERRSSARAAATAAAGPALRPKVCLAELLRECDERLCGSVCMCMWLCVYVCVFVCVCVCVCEDDGRGVERSRDLDSVTNVKVRLSEEWRKAVIVRRETRAFDTMQLW